MAPTTISFPRPNSQQSCLFLSKLHAELRNQIYELALSNQNHTSAGCWPMYIEGDPEEDVLEEETKQPLALLATCSQIYHEAAGFYFNIHHIGFLRPSDCCAFLDQVGSRHIDAVKRLTVMIGEDRAGEQAKEVVKVVAGFPRLEVLTLRIEENEIEADEVLELLWRRCRRELRRCRW